MQAQRREAARGKCACALHLRGRDRVSICAPPPFSRSERSCILWVSGYLNLCDLCTRGPSLFSTSPTRVWLRVRFPDALLSPSPWGCQLPLHLHPLEQGT